MREGKRRMESERERKGLSNRDGRNEVFCRVGATLGVMCLTPSVIVLGSGYGSTSLKNAMTPNKSNASVPSVDPFSWVKELDPCYPR